MELKIFDYKSPSFDKEYYDYIEEVDKWEYQTGKPVICSNGQEGRIPCEKSYAMAQWLKSEVHQFPKFIKDFMEYLLTTPFFKNKVSKISFKNPFNEYDCACVHWQTFTGDRRECLSDTIYNMLNDGVAFGEVSYYQGDRETVVYINFKNKFAEIRRGYATGLYASKVIRNKYPIPKYMQPRIEQLFKDYEDYVKEQ